MQMSVLKFLLAMAAIEFILDNINGKVWSTQILQQLNDLTSTSVTMSFNLNIQSSKEALGWEHGIGPTRVHREEDLMSQN